MTKIFNTNFLENETFGEPPLIIGSIKNNPVIILPDSGCTISVMPRSSFDKFMSENLIDKESVRFVAEKAAMLDGQLTTFKTKCCLNLQLGNQIKKIHIFIIDTVEKLSYDILMGIQSLKQFGSIEFDWKNSEIIIDQNIVLQIKKKHEALNFIYYHEKAKIENSSKNLDFVKNKNVDFSIGEELSNSLTNLTIAAIITEINERALIKGHINQTELTLLVDANSPFTIISKRAFNKIILRKNNVAQLIEMNLKIFDNKIIKISEIVPNIIISLSQKSCNINIFVTETQEFQNFDAILGRDLLVKFKNELILERSQLLPDFNLFFFRTNKKTDNKRKFKKKSIDFYTAQRNFSNFTVN